MEATHRPNPAPSCTKTLKQLSHFTLSQINDLAACTFICILRVEFRTGGCLHGASCSSLPTSPRRRVTRSRRRSRRSLSRRLGSSTPSSRWSELIEPGIGVGLKDPGIAGEMHCECQSAQDRGSVRGRSLDRAAHQPAASDDRLRGRRYDYSAGATSLRRPYSVGGIFKLLKHPVVLDGPGPSFRSVTTSVSSHIGRDSMTIVSA